MPVVGIDVAKKTFEAAFQQDGKWQCHSFSNSPAGFRRLQCLLKELGAVLTEPNDRANKQARIDKLAVHFQEEIAGVKSRLGKITPAQKTVAAPAITPAQPATEPAAEEVPAEEPLPVFGANMSKEEQGIQISGGEETAPLGETGGEAPAVPAETATTIPATVENEATSTAEVAETVCGDISGITGVDLV